MKRFIAFLTGCILGLAALPPLRADVTPPDVMTVHERDVIEQAMRTNLALRPGTPIGPAERARVNRLDLRFNHRLTDAAAAWLADPATGLSALTELDLSDTKLTDAAMAALSRPDTGLKNLSSLVVPGNVTDQGVVALARADSGLKSLRTLDLTDTKVTDAGVAALARPGTGLKSLTSLDLTATQVGDKGVAA